MRDLGNHWNICHVVQQTRKFSQAELLLCQIGIELIDPDENRTVELEVNSDEERTVETEEQEDEEDEEEDDDEEPEEPEEDLFMNVIETCRFDDRPGSSFRLLDGIYLRTGRLSGYVVDREDNVFYANKHESEYEFNIQPIASFQELCFKDDPFRVKLTDVEDGRPVGAFVLNWNDLVNLLENM